MFLVALFVPVLLSALLLDSGLGAPDMYAGRRLVLVAVVSVLAISTLLIRNFWRARAPALWVLVAMLVLAGLSEWRHGGHEYALAELGLLPFWLLAAMALSVWIRRVGVEPAWRYFLIVVVLVEFLYAVSVLVTYVAAMQDGVTRLSRYLPNGYANIRYWSHTATWLLPLLPLAAVLPGMARPRVWSVLVYCVAGIMWWLALLSMARGTLLALGVATGIVMLVVRRPALDWFKGMLKQLSVGVAVWLLLSVLIPYLMIPDPAYAHKGLSYSSSGRWVLWVEAIRMSLQHFPLGMGVQSWLYHEPLTAAFAESRRFGHPHNMYLLWAAEYGWLYTGLFLVFCYKVLDLPRLAERLRRPATGRQGMVVALMVSLLAAGVHAGFSAVFLAPASMLIGVLVCGFVLACLGPVYSEENRASVPGGYGWLRWVQTTLICAISFFWLADVGLYYMDMVSEFALKQDVMVAMPRFWLYFEVEG